MVDVRAPLRVIDEFLWMLRRSGMTVATSQAIDAVRTARAVGFGSEETLRDALAAVLVTQPRERIRFDRTFRAFFARDRARRTLYERLEAEGFTAEEVAVLRATLEAIAGSTPEGGALAPLLHKGADLNRLLHLAGTARSLEGMQSPLQAGFFTHRLLDQVGVWRAGDELTAVRLQLADALGAERADAMAAALKRELSLGADEVRAFVQDALAERAAGEERPLDLIGTPFAALDEAEILEVRRAVRAFVDRLRGGERVRRRRASRGKIDPHGTLRRAMRTGGVPFKVMRRRRRRDKPKLIVLCDVSESVRAVSRFLLELAFASQELFSGTRTFVFVSELGETTSLFAETSIERALARAWSGGVVPITHNSNYGRAFRAFEARVLPDVDRRTTVVVLGDGRTNYLEPAADVLDAIRTRARALLWLCPEPRGSWAVGDSAMPRYAPKCSAVLEVRTARDLEEAARLVLRMRR